MGSQRSQVPLVKRRVRVLLRVHHPDQEVGERHDPIHLEPVRGLDRVEVRQVEEHQAVEPAVVAPVASRDLQPVEQGIGAVAPRRRLPLRGGRPAAADGRELVAGEGVEEHRLPDAGRAGERDDGRLDAQAETGPRLLRHRPGSLDRVGA